MRSTWISSPCKSASLRLFLCWDDIFPLDLDIPHRSSSNCACWYPPLAALSISPCMIAVKDFKTRRRAFFVCFSFSNETARMLFRFFAGTLLVAGCLGTSFHPYSNLCSKNANEEGIAAFLVGVSLTTVISLAKQHVCLRHKVQA